MTRSPPSGQPLPGPERGARDGGKHSLQSTRKSATLRSMDAHPRAPELKPGFAWLNTDRPLAFSKELKGQVVLLDFWTYCCINCMHVLPDLAYLEEKYAREPFLVVGVHSAKFANEGSRQTIRAARRYWRIRLPITTADRRSP